MSKQDLIDVYEDTIKLCHNNSSPKEFLEKLLSDVLDTADLSTIIMTPKYAVMHVVVENEDVLYIAHKYQHEGNLMILNLASDKTPGGGVKKGSMAQEEEIFRRTNYFLHMSYSLYPIKATNVIYTAKVCVMKDKSYGQLVKPFVISSLAACAVRNPYIDEKGFYTKNDYTTMMDTIDNIFRSAYLKNHDILVLGALGCGAFHNPPKAVIGIFNRYLKKYWGCFKKIIFAVYSKNKYDNNYTLFNNKIIRKG